jgi:putative endonuclease
LVLEGFGDRKRRATVVLNLFRKRAAQRAMGDTFEHAALNFLERNGLVLVTRNWQCAQGEIDLVMREGSQLVFVEVRRRSSNRFGSALASIDRAKLSRVWAAVNVYISKLPQRPDYRLDAIAFDADGLPQWVRNVAA